MNLVALAVTLTPVPIDLVAMIVAGTTLGLELSAAELVRRIEEYLRRDAPKNLLKILTAEVEAAFSEEEAEEMLKQFATQMRREVAFDAFRDFVERSSPDALSDVRAELADGFDETKLSMPATEAATWIVDVLRSRLGEAQSNAGRAIDARGEYDRASIETTVARSTEGVKRGQEELARGIEEVALGNERMNQALVALSTTEMALVRTKYASRDSAPATAQRAMERLGAASPDLLTNLYEHAGDPIDVARALGLIEASPAWAADAPVEYHRALARLAETAGEWDAATDAWERATELVEGNTAQADAYSRAAVAAGVAGDESRRERLLESAREHDAQAPRLVLEEMPDDLPPAEQLEVLNSIETDDEELLALIAAHRAVAYLLLADLPAAGREFKVAEELASEAVFTRSVGINIHVQRGRLDLHEGRPVDGPALRRAWQQALALRDQLLSERRFEESARLLMLACDALAVSGERGRAVELLGEVRAEERQAPSGAEVLGDLALRCGAERRALELTAEAPNAPGIRRIRATGEFYSGTSAVVLAAGETLDEIIVQGGKEADLAALERLMLPMFRKAVSWSETAEQHLLESGHARAAISARAIYLANIVHDHAGACELLEAHKNEVWGGLAKFRVALIQGLTEDIVETARALLALAPDQIHALECAKALRTARRPDLAVDALRPLVRDRAAPGEIASRGYDLLMRSLFDLGEEEQAVALFEDWQRERPGDQRADPWQPRIANRARRRDG